jgi:glycosyltransferase involved in cell wall biosynthesis
MPSKPTIGHKRSRARYLWVTWIDPFPEHDGQRMYSGRLIESVAAAGVTVEVLCLSNEDSALRRFDPGGRTVWRTIGESTRPGWQSAISSLPNSAHRCATRNMRRTFERLIGQENWNAVVLDGLSAGWTIETLATHPEKRAGGPKIVYVAHNHEESTRATIVRNYRGNPITRAMLDRDSAKSRRLERQLVERADLVTAITPEDGARFREYDGDKHVTILPPGYAGRRVQYRTITLDMPRLAVIVGSFEWIAKRMNLEAFLAIADPLFARYDARLQIIGNAPKRLIDRLHRRTQATDFLGTVPSIEPHLSDARIAIVPETTGGGFKLKILDYVFHRLPIMATDGSTAGTPLRPSHEILTFTDFEKLAHGVVGAMDDVNLLNQLQNSAYAACDTLFDWRSRGEQFVMETTAA